MKRKLSYLLMGIIVSSMLFVSCEKLNDQSIDKSLESNNVVVKSTTNFYWENVEGQVTENRINPLDYVGYEHNIAMQEIEVKCTPEMSYEEVMNIVQGYLLEKYEEELSGFNDPAEFLTKTANSTINAFKEGAEYDYVENLKLSKIEKSEMKNLQDIIYEYNVKNYSDIIIAVKSFESDLLNKYDKKDIEVVLCATSISRFSLAYWNNRMDSSNKSWKKWVVGACDVIGGAAGGAAGSGTVVGAAAGAVVGAGAASAAAAKIWDIMAEK